MTRHEFCVILTIIVEMDGGFPQLDLMKNYSYFAHLQRIHHEYH